MSKKFILLTAGGTGGHIFPAESLAEKLLTQGYRLGFMTDKRGKHYGGLLSKIDLFLVRSAGLAGRSIIAKMRALFDLVIGIVQALWILYSDKPKVIIGFGGYASFPCLIAAIILNIPFILHEQNAVLGRANRFLAPFATLIALSYPKVKFVKKKWENKCIFVGMPVRKFIVDFHQHPFPPLTKESPINLLILGGSQGATILSKMVPAGLGLLPESLKKRLIVTQQCRESDLDSVKTYYSTTSINAEISIFFDNIPERLAKAHLVISRSGASSMAEFAMVGRPAILIPFSHAIDDHQTANAQDFVAQKAGWIIPEQELSPDSIARKIELLLAEPSILQSAAHQASHCASPQASESLAGLVEKLITEEIKS
jgi:UDP-N-acetylglucosamine--N-acetylmuramyl-(pentapeptide) pyrophosphoryl-undecaprenol N-acetylglucosamine transferase